MLHLAHAKINLNLRILGKRPDGYHELETLMVPLALHDEVEVDLTTDNQISISCDESLAPQDESNLAFKAARLFFEETGISSGAKIRLEKNIPSGAGLGGGSSDAACVLRALNQLCGAELSQDHLEHLAAKLGSDVPWFVRSRPALCRGRGEILEPVNLEEAPSLLLLKPGFGVSTPWAYQAWGRLPAQVPPPCQDLGWIKIFNDLEAPVFRKFVLLGCMKNWLCRQPGVLAAGMSGSGSTLFALMESDADRLKDSACSLFGETLWTCQTQILLEHFKYT